MFVFTFFVFFFCEKYDFQLIISVVLHFYFIFPPVQFIFFVFLSMFFMKTEKKFYAGQPHLSVRKIHASEGIQNCHSWAAQMLATALFHNE